MKKLFVIAAFILLCICPRAEALFVNIENIGSLPLVAVNINFNILSPSREQTFFQIFSDRAREDFTNIYFPDPFDWDHPLGVGASLNTYLIPEITDTNARFVGGGISTYWAYSGGSEFPITIIPDITVIDFVSGSPSIPIAARFSFRSGGEPAPVPAPSTMILLGSGLVGVIGFRRIQK